MMTSYVAMIVERVLRRQRASCVSIVISGLRSRSRVRAASSFGRPTSEVP